MKTLFATVAACAALIGFIPAASGQGTVTFTPITSQSQLTPYQGQAAWTLTLDVQHGGAGYLFTDTATNSYTSGLNIAYSASVLLSESGGTVTASDQILNGRFGSTGATGGTSISSLTPLTGVLIYMTDAFPGPDTGSGLGGATISSLYIGSNYQPTVADTTSGETFGGGMLCSFSDPTASLNSLAFTLNQPSGAGGEKIFVVGLEANAVPEPSTIALAGIGGLAMLTVFRRKK